MKRTLLDDIQTYINRFMVFTDADAYSFACSLWVLMTYVWPHFDAVPYLSITSHTKRSGKTRLSELLQYISYNAYALAGVTPATIFRLIKDKNPTLFIDEAELFSGDAASMFRAIINVGYRKGQTIPRVSDNGVEQWSVFCPKAFILIGDMTDTTKDRSIVIQLVRGQPQERFQIDVVKAGATVIAGRIAAWVQEHKTDILAAYNDIRGLPFLPDRDEEIWLPLFALCHVIAPDRIPELQRVAVDMATEKTRPVVKYTSDVMDKAEDAATNAEYSEHLLRDLLSVMKGKYAVNIYTREAIAALYAIPTAPWRKFRGVGLTPNDIAALLAPHHVEPQHIRRGNSAKEDSTVARGYRRVDIAKAVKQLG